MDTNKTTAPKAETFTWGQKEFGNVAKLFHAEPAPLQTGLRAVCGILQVIKLNIKESPVVIIYLIRKAYPQFNEGELLSLLQEAFNTVLSQRELSAESLNEFITGLSTHISEATAVEWNVFWDGMAKALSAASLTGILWEKICAYLPYVYNVLVKPVVR